MTTQKERFEADLLKLDYGQHLEFDYKGRHCVIARHKELGHLCGYAKDDLGVDVDLDKLFVHGGVTFHGTLSQFGFTGHYIGFDTAHIMDWFPIFGAPIGLDTDLCKAEYRDVDYVELEIKSLVDQIIKLEVVE